MKRFISPRPMKASFIGFVLILTTFAVQADPVGVAAENYFSTLFSQLEQVAEQKPTVKTFRAAMKPCAEATDGFFGGSYIDTDYTIRQVYKKRNFLARGFDLRKVNPLEPFWKEMAAQPSAQLSEPSNGGLFRPSLISLRVPILTNGKLEAVVSLMVRTERFLKATGLDECNAFKIICRGELAEEKGKLSDQPHEVKLALPSTVWVIQYDR